MSVCARAAFEQLQEEQVKRGSAPKKLYYFAFPRSRMKDAWERMVAAEPDSPMAQIDVNQLGVADEDITLTVDVSRHEQILSKAFAVHASQQSPLERMDGESASQFLHNASYIRVFPQPAISGDESALFDGV
jgi:hypothetical protein